MKSRAQYLVMLFAVVAGFCALVLGIGRATWTLSPAGREDFDALRKMPEPDRRPTAVKGIHRIEEWPASKGRKFIEPPILKPLVESGALPPVDQRLPDDPLVIVPPRQIGPYGGTWLNYTTGRDDLNVQEGRVNYTGLIRWDPSYQNYWPDLATRWEISPDGRTYTFWLRKGVKWSDGVPFTADDILFWYNDVLMNTDYTPVPAVVLAPAGKTMDMVKLDDYTVQFRFEHPSGLFLHALAQGTAQSMVSYPAHYLKQFHPSHVSPEEIQARIQAAGVSNWVILFRDRASGSNPDRPGIGAWICRTDVTKWPVIYERNPYYWKVDPEGNQLPYIDKLTYQNLAESAIQFRALRGEMGLLYRTSYLKEQDYPLYMRSREKGHYRVLYRLSSSGMTHTVCVNTSHLNPEIRKVFGQADFRKALSYSINRNQINEACFMGWGIPRQVMPYEYSPVYMPGYENSYIEYDPDRADQMLDAIGMDKRDSEGYRCLPNGEQLAIYLECATNFTNPDVAELIARDWRAVGIRTDLKVLGRQLFETRLKSNIYDAAMWAGGDLINPIGDPRNIFPDRDATRMGSAYGLWYMKQRQAGEEPPPEMKRCMEIYWKILETPDRAAQITMFKEILEIAHEQLWHIGIVGNIPVYYLIADGFLNVPEVSVEGRYSPGETAPECFAMEKARE